MSFSIPLRNRQAQADYASSQLEIRQDELNLQKQLNQIRVDVQNAVIGVQQARVRYDSSVKARILQQQTMDADKKKYTLGASTVFQVVQDQRDLATAETTEVEALANYSHARVALDQAVGTTLELNHISLPEALAGKVSRQSVLPANLPTGNTAPVAQPTECDTGGTGSAAMSRASRFSRAKRWPSRNVAFCGVPMVFAQTPSAQPIPPTAPGENTTGGQMAAGQASANALAPIEPHKPKVPWIIRPYTPTVVPPTRLYNSGRLGSLVQGGNLYLTVQDAIALALENNVDIEIARYNPIVSAWNLERSEAGGALPGVPTGSSQASTVTSGQGVAGSEASAGVNVGGTARCLRIQPPP